MKTAEDYVRLVIADYDEDTEWNHTTSLERLVSNADRLDFALDLEMLADVNIYDDEIDAWKNVGNVINTIQRKLETRL